MVKKKAHRKSLGGSREIKQNKSNFILLLSVVALLTVGLYFAVAQMTPKTNYIMPTTGVAEDMPLYMDELNPVIVLNEQNNSGEFGNASLSEENGKVVVTVMVNNAPRGVAQPAHLHTGSCISLGQVVYPLTNVIGGKSVTTLNITLSEIKSKLPLALNVHKSTSQIGTYVSCGNLELH